jgi:hypothetical protein
VSLLALLPVFIRGKGKIPKAQVGIGLILIPALIVEFVYRFAP